MVFSVVSAISPIQRLLGLPLLVFIGSGKMIKIFLYCKKKKHSKIKFKITIGREKGFLSFTLSNTILNVFIAHPRSKIVLNRTMFNIRSGSEVV
jgi:hypothetical protein